jgi:type II secretory pathway component PulF
MAVLALGLITFVLPQFKAILDEVVAGDELLPRSTRALIWIVDTFFRRVHPALLLGMVALIWVAGWLRRAGRRRRPGKPTVSLRINDLLRWHLPIFHWFERNHSTLQVVELMRMSFNAGAPVNEAIRGALDLDLNLCFKRLLRQWLERVERGEDIAAAARAAGMGRALAWAFDNSDHAGGTPALLEMLESYYRSNYSYRVNLARFILWPCGIILLGVTVGFVVYATYAPMAAVLQQFTNVVYP